MKNILFITNGHGEDLAAAEIIKRLDGKAEMTVLPLVGEGRSFDNLPVKTLGPRKKLPSGGFSLRNPLYLARDIYAGLIGSTMKELSLLKNLQDKFDLAVAIGDIVPIIAAMKAKLPFVFVGVNKSDHYKWFGYHYTPWEKSLLRGKALKVFVRDRITEHNLKNRGIKVRNAEYAGNLLMDPIAPLPAHKDTGKGFTIGLLPGTREDAHLNLEDLARVAAELKKTANHHDGIRFITATALALNHFGSGLDNLPPLLQKKSFMELLAEADLVIGLSGTGNEQAAGCGIPLVSFYGRGSQYNKKFAQAQKQLLGGALSLVRDNDPICVAAEVWELLRRSDKMKEMARAGKERRGEPGAADRIAAFILELK
jgi:hypothetical protein